MIFILFQILLQFIREYVKNNDPQIGILYYGDTVEVGIDLNVDRHSYHELEDSVKVIKEEYDRSRYRDNGTCLIFRPSFGANGVKFSLFHRCCANVYFCVKGKSMLCLIKNRCAFLFLCKKYFYLAWNFFHFACIIFRPERGAEDDTGT